MKKIHSNSELIIFDKYQDKIILHTDTDSLASTLIYKEEQKKKYQIKKYNAILTSKRGEKLMVFQNILRKASLELKSEQLRLFIYMLSVCEFENWIHLSQSDISLAMEIKIPHISRALKALRENSYIEVIKKSNSNYYRISPDVGWKGKMEEWTKTIDLNGSVK